MDKLIIEGGNELSGSISVSCAKNSYLPILAATLLSDKPIHLKNLPELRDIRTMLKLLGNLGADIQKNGNITTINCSKIENYSATYDLVKTMRASILVLGPLLARFKKGIVSLPGGCAIGTRPIDLHLKYLQEMGANIELKEGNVDAKTQGLQGAKLVLPFPSVGATENLMMAASLASGTTIIENAAMEPEIDDLANFLNAMGAKISGIGESRIVIDGVSSFKEVEYQAIGDRIEAGTFIMAGLMTNSQLKVQDFNPQHLSAVLDSLVEMGAKLDIDENSVTTYPSDLKPVKIDTAPYPGFPTDMQAQMTALATTISGTSIITEHIFENRFMHIPELMRMGARISLKGNSAIVEGGNELSGAPVMCTDLRASAALVLASLAANGRSDVQRVYHLDRGYEKIGMKLQGVGASIKRVNEE